MDRDPFAEAAGVFFDRVERGDLSGWVCATTVTTVFYLTQKATDASGATRTVDRLLTLFQVAPVNEAVLGSALEKAFPDYEDAVLHESARHRGLEGIITRNTDDFQEASLPIYSPVEFVSILQSREEDLD